jgi:hypothetical protein
MERQHRRGLTISKLPCSLINNTAVSAAFSQKLGRRTSGSSPIEALSVGVPVPRRGCSTLRASGPMLVGLVGTRTSSIGRKAATSSGSHPKRRMVWVWSLERQRVGSAGVPRIRFSPSVVLANCANREVFVERAFSLHGVFSERTKDEDVVVALNKFLLTPDPILRSSNRRTGLRLVRGNGIVVVARGHSQAEDVLQASVTRIQYYLFQKSIRVMVFRSW